MVATAPGELAQCELARRGLLFLPRSGHILARGCGTEALFSRWFGQGRRDRPTAPAPPPGMTDSGAGIRHGQAPTNYVQRRAQDVARLGIYRYEGGAAWRPRLPPPAKPQLHLRTNVAGETATRLLPRVSPATSECDIARRGVKATRIAAYLRLAVALELVSARLSCGSSLAATRAASTFPRWSAFLKIADGLPCEVEVASLAGAGNGCRESSAGTSLPNGMRGDAVTFSPIQESASSASSATSSTTASSFSSSRSSRRRLAIRL